MSDYKELIKVLRCIGKQQDCNECEAGRWHHDLDCCLFEKAADAIENLLATRTDELNNAWKQGYDAAAEIPMSALNAMERAGWLAGKEYAERRRTKMLIIDMQMPISCEECRFAVDGWCYAIRAEDRQLSGLHFLTRPEWCPLKAVTRADLVEAWQGIDTLLCALEGKAPEMTDKDAARAMARAIWITLNWIVRRIDKEDKHGEQ